MAGIQVASLLLVLGWLPLSDSRRTIKKATWDAGMDTHSLLEEPRKARVLIIGSPKSGKSTLCQWLLGRTDVCSVHGVISEHTVALERAIGYWFNDPALGELEVLDTPAFLSEGSVWGGFVDYFQTSKDSFDAVIFCHAWMGAGNQLEVLSKFRQTFGPDVWDRMVAFVPVREKWFAPEVGQWAGMRNDTWEAMKLAALGDLVQLEGGQDVPGIAAIKFYGSYLKASPYWPMVSAASPDFNKEGGVVHSPETIRARLVTTRLTDLNAMRTGILAMQASSLGS